MAADATVPYNDAQDGSPPMHKEQHATRMPKSDFRPPGPDENVCVLNGILQIRPDAIPLEMWALTAVLCDERRSEKERHSAWTVYSTDLKARCDHAAKQVETGESKFDLHDSQLALPDLSVVDRICGSDKELFATLATCATDKKKCARDLEYSCHACHNFDQATIKRLRDVNETLREKVQELKQQIWPCPLSVPASTTTQQSRWNYEPSKMDTEGHFAEVLRLLQASLFGSANLGSKLASDAHASFGALRKMAPAGHDKVLAFAANLSYHIHYIMQGRYHGDLCSDASKNKMLVINTNTDRRAAYQYLWVPDPHPSGQQAQLGSLTVSSGIFVLRQETKLCRFYITSSDDDGVTGHIEHSYGKAGSISHLSRGQQAALVPLLDGDQLRDHERMRTDVIYTTGRKLDFQSWLSVEQRTLEWNSPMISASGGVHQYSRVNFNEIVAEVERVKEAKRREATRSY